MADENATRTSLLDAIQDRRQKEGRAPGVSRIVFCAKVTDQLKKVDDLSSYFESCFSKLEDEFSGILLVLHNMSLFLLEAPAKALNGLILELHSHQANGLLTDLKVVVSSEDVDRTFPIWLARTLSGPKGDANVDASKEESDNTMAEVYLNLLKVGQQLSEAGRGDAGPALDNIRTNSREMLPVHEQLVIIATHPCIFQLDDFVNLYLTPVDLSMESERIWPLPRPLKYPLSDEPQMSRVHQAV